MLGLNHQLRVDHQKICKFPQNQRYLVPSKCITATIWKIGCLRQRSCAQLSQSNLQTGRLNMRISDAISLTTQYGNVLCQKEQDKVAMRDDDLACGISRCVCDILYTVQMSKATSSKKGQIEPLVSRQKNCCLLRFCEGNHSCPKPR